MGKSVIEPVWLQTLLHFFKKQWFVDDKNYNENDLIGWELIIFITTYIGCRKIFGFRRIRAKEVLAKYLQWFTILSKSSDLLDYVLY